ncbi:hypothetical protein ASL20_09870 [Cupriavidus necator]|uniref:hypothetical protein n=1 Tax=Cupriavidus necator TaxID=106590 RepID=UPI000735C8E9|nr:hypothetical protein [Cupriavidus necator]KUE89126.1 hypothetical protein ASL20_09870 [Cupriavidus necator]
MSKERPILFSGAMVRATLDGRKMQTRRIMKPQPVIDGTWHSLPNYSASSERAFCDGAPYFGNCPYGKAEDRLWVRETWAQPVALDPGPTVYRADYPECVPAGFENVPPAEAIRWKPSIHMPRALCRLELEITALRAERLNDCSEADAIAEGIAPELDGWTDYSNPSCQMCMNPVDSYRTLWNSINGADAWDTNPRVWVVGFRRVEP